MGNLQNNYNNLDGQNSQSQTNIPLDYDYNRIMRLIDQNGGFERTLPGIILNYYF